MGAYTVRRDADVNRTVRPICARRGRRLRPVPFDVVGGG
jgi:hypothetical protein